MTALPEKQAGGVQEPQAQPIPKTLPAKPCQSRPGQGPEMVIIPAGRMLMGSSAKESGRYDDEGPQHGVAVVQPFALMRCEVTRGEFRAFVDETGYRTDAEVGERGCFALKDDGSWDGEYRKDRDWRNPGFAQSDDHPVVCVSWRDAWAYAHWLSLRTGQPYRLPTAAEWEYAARAGTVTARFWGDDPENQEACGFANGADLTLKQRFDSAETNQCHDGYLFTSPAGSFSRNAFGLSDMLGNVWEWTADCWHENYQGAPVNGVSWLDEQGGDCARRVVRGGGWYTRPRDLRSAVRGRNGTGVTSIYQGFRLARAL